MTVAHLSYLKLKHSLIVILLLSLQGFSVSANAKSLTTWLNSEEKIATENLLANISPSGTSPGVVVAAPSKQDPNYFFHWVRDAGLVMQVVAGLHSQSFNPKEKTRLTQMMLDFADFSRKNQLTPTLSIGLGEPKFNVDGSAYNEPWGRPQNDGPAIRASALIRLANILINDGKEDLVRRKLYSNELPAETVIKADLEFISHHWRETSFDLWEEVKGNHFYTRMVQRRALLDGAGLADFMGDYGAADWYRNQAKEMENEIGKHWDSSNGYIRVTLDRDGGLDYKSSGLDVAVVLAALHGATGDDFFAVDSDKLLATAHRIRQEFEKIYPINGVTHFEGEEMGTAIGRYPEDRYDGYGSSWGNPWVLATCAYAELYFKVARKWRERGYIEVTHRNMDFINSLEGMRSNKITQAGKVHAGDARFNQILGGLNKDGRDFLRRVQYHSNPDGSLSEQMNKHTGYMQGAPHLTWSYAGALTAIWAK